MTIQLLTGDCRSVLPTLPADSVHCVVTSPPYYGLRSYLDASHPDKHREIGSEPTPEAYLATMVQVFREIRRVLRPDGTCWVNMGDSYCSTAPGTMGDGINQRGILAGVSDRRAAASRKFRPETPHGLKPKDLLMMPARLALALQADGWWVRSDIIWAKPNPMPESCTDRPTSAHEHIFLLTKSARYFYDAEAVREVAECKSQNWAAAGFGATGLKRREVGCVSRDEMPTHRNLRNVWTLATHAFPEAHFATYAPELVERCIKAGTSERGCCAACGEPLRRFTERSVAFTSGWAKAGVAPADRAGSKHAGAEQALSGNYDIRMGPNVTSITTGWASSCRCYASTVPCTVLDPFLGSGTTALVADRLQRHAIGIDLSLTYAEMAQRRIEMDAGMFADMAPAPEPPEDERMRDLFAEAAE